MLEVGQGVARLLVRLYLVEGKTNGNDVLVQRRKKVSTLGHDLTKGRIVPKTPPRAADTS
jgi:hypothetical protein